jgi:hypothetical protein
MGWWGAVLRNHAAKRYARRLPAALVEGWGGSKFYTQAQIDTAVHSLKLDPRHIVLAHATYLPREQFEALAAQTPLPMTYLEARELFRSFVPLISAFSEDTRVGGPEVGGAGDAFGG